METTPTKKAGVFPLVLLLVGVALGAAGAALVSRWVDPGLLAPFRDGEGVEGRVLEKALESDRLLLKIESEHGVFLATFTARQAEIDLLVEPGDTVTLDAREYRPFLEDPTLDRVIKPKPPLEAEDPGEEPGVEAGAEDEPLVDELEEVEPAAEPPREEETPA
jgi:hypothetical protein